jgi:hypothetical protein
MASVIYVFSLSSTLTGWMCELLAIRVSVCVVYPCNVVSLVIYCANLKK